MLALRHRDISPSEIAAFSDPDGEPYYHPNGRVANNSLWLNPVTGADMYGAPVEVEFQTGAYPPRDDGPQHSWDQGLGRSPGQQWPHMPIRQQFAFESSTNMSGIMEDTGALREVHASERDGWALGGPAALGEMHYEQDPGEHQWIPDPISIENVPAIPMTDLDFVGGYE